jgi:hypothetical protein
MMLIPIEVDRDVVTAARVRAQEKGTSLEAAVTAFLRRYAAASVKPRTKISEAAPAPPAPEPRLATPAAMLEALAETANADGTVRFHVPRGDEFDKRHLPALHRLIRAFPDLSDWRRHGEWIRAGYLDWMLRSGPVSVTYVTGGRFRADMGLSRTWAAAGRKPASATAPGRPQRRRLATEPEDFA